MTTYSSYQPGSMRSTGEGWRTFAGIVIMIVGVFNFIDGIVAVANPHYIAIQPTGYGTGHLVFGDLTAWGWAILVLGIIQVLTAFAILSGRSWAAVVGIVVAGLNAIGQLLYLGVNPWWSIIAIGLDILVIYGLAVYGFTPRSSDVDAGPAMGAPTMGGPTMGGPTGPTP